MERISLARIRGVTEIVMKDKAIERIGEDVSEAVNQRFVLDYYEHIRI